MDGDIRTRSVDEARETRERLARCENALAALTEASLTGRPVNFGGLPVPEVVVETVARSTGG